MGWKGWMEYMEQMGWMDGRVDGWRHRWDGWDVTDGCMDGFTSFRPSIYPSTYS